jgi:hypothetical protein
MSDLDILATNVALPISKNFSRLFVKIAYANIPTTGGNKNKL